MEKSAAACAASLLRSFRKGNEERPANDVAVIHDGPECCIYLSADVRSADRDGDETRRLLEQFTQYPGGKIRWLLDSVSSSAAHILSIPRIEEAEAPLSAYYSVTKGIAAIPQCCSKLGKW